jgi:glutamyl-Q tRNA(Asp) synthetase
VYTGRFAPSPTGPLHAGSLVAALASWLDARAHGGIWLVRIEDVDAPRCVAGAVEQILSQLAALGLTPDHPPVWQSRRQQAYARALERLLTAGLAYACGCSRADIERAWLAQGLPHERHTERVYPGTCRNGLDGKTPRAWRMRTWISEQNRALAPARYGSPAIDLIADSLVQWHDRRLGPQHQDVSQAVGDFVLLRADGLWAYQLAVVVDDADQGITDVVRGEDLADNTPRQILLQHALGLPTLRYLHTPLVRNAAGEKLSKQQGAIAVDTTAPLVALKAAAAHLGLVETGGAEDEIGAWLAHAVAQWRERYGRPAAAPADNRP